MAGIETGITRAAQDALLQMEASIGAQLADPACTGAERAAAKLVAVTFRPAILWLVENKEDNADPFELLQAIGMGMGSITTSLVASTVGAGSAPCASAMVMEMIGNCLIAVASGTVEEDGGKLVSVPIEGVGHA